MNVINSTAFAEGEAPVFYLVDEHEHPEGASTMLGFWIYLMSDCLIFAVLFATYGVLGGNYAAGPAPKDLFELPLVALNTSMLLMSSITYGFDMLTMDKGQVRATQIWLAVLSFAGLLAVAIGHTFNYKRDFHLPVDVVVQAEGERTRLLAQV